jgi:sugar (pentulose or hexulose) kinase
MAARFDGRRVMLEEVTRFPNHPVSEGETLRWDITRLVQQVRAGILRAAHLYGRSLVSVGVAGWGVDYGLLDSSGDLLARPYSYRDNRTADTPAQVFSRIDERAWFRKTGVATSPINTIFQLAWAAEHEKPLLERAERALLISDLVSYQLSGEPTTELTIGSTTQMMDIRSRRWLRSDLTEIGIPHHLFRDPVPPGTVTAGADSPIAAAAGLPVSVVAVAGHDTASAFAGSGAASGDAILSSGTWALLGVQSSTAHTDNVALEAGLTNELGADGGVRTLRNLTGFWILQQCMRVWQTSSDDIDFASLASEAEQAPAFSAVIDTNDPRFSSPGDMPEKIDQFCKETQQDIPRNRGEVTRVILESLALQFRRTHRDLEKIVGDRIPGITVVGGGARNQLLNQLTASAAMVPVTVGQPEATSLGNALVQMKASGHISNLTEGQQLIADSYRQQVFTPVADPRWQEAAERMESTKP